MLGLGGSDFLVLFAISVSLSYRSGQGFKSHPLRMIMTKYESNELGLKIIGETIPRT